MTIPTEQLLNIPGTRVLSVEYYENKIECQIESTQGYSICHKCGRNATEFHEHEKQLELRHLPLCGQQVILWLRPRRYRCLHCDGIVTTTERQAWYDAKAVSGRMLCCKQRKSTSGEITPLLCRDAARCLGAADRHVPVGRKDPEVQVRTAVALTSWRGASAEKVEQLVTKKIETQMAANAKVTKIESISRTGLSVVYLDLDENLKETGKELDDIKLKLDGIRDLPDGAGPINFIKDFGDTAALMLTVASPKASDLEIELRAKAIQPVIEQARAQARPAVPPSGGSGPGRAALIACLPQSLSEGAGENLQPVRKHRDLFVEYLEEQKVIADARPLEGAGFIGVDAASVDDAALLKAAAAFVRERLQAAEFHPDSWPIAVIRDPRETRERLAAVASDKYSYRELDQFTDLIEKTIKTLPTVSKVSRTGLLEERVFLYYSQERLAAYGIQNAKLPDILSARNITLPGGQLEAEGKNLSIDPTGEFKSEKEIGDVAVATSDNGAPVYLRDLADVVRGYDNPPRFLNYYNWRDAKGEWHRTRAVTLSVQMRSGEQIGKFGEGIDATLADLKKRPPDDLVMARTSDQPLQVRESVDLFMNSLYEAVILVVIVSLIGFWEWRSAVLMALSMPITLLMTFGMMCGCRKTRRSPRRTRPPIAPKW